MTVSSSVDRSHLGLMTALADLVSTIIYPELNDTEDNHQL